MKTKFKEEQVICQEFNEIVSVKVVLNVRHNLRLDGFGLYRTLMQKNPGKLTLISFYSIYSRLKFLLIYFNSYFRKFN